MKLKPHNVPIGSESIDRFAPLLGQEHVENARTIAEQVAERMRGRVWWSINSTSTGGGVAEMLRPLIAYARGLDIDARWLVIEGTPVFFGVTKRIHHALHGMAGDGGDLGQDERTIYEDVLAANAKELLVTIRPEDIVLLHDPQTAGLAPILIEHGARVIWRSHVGADVPNEQTDKAWNFLAPYLEDVPVSVFSRHAYIPDCCHPERSVVIPPSIDAFSAKNQEMDTDTVRSILVHTGLVEGPTGPGEPAFLREDGSPGRIDRQADIVRLGRTPSWETPLVVQVSRWDPLKDPIGVMRAFATLIDGSAPRGAELVLAGPNVTAVSDDPEGAATFEAVVDLWRRLPEGERGRIHLASLPMDDVEENAAMVNALQRHAAVVVQKSLREGFGLTVTEAMWKGRPVVASRIGGIQDQIVDGEHGLLVEPTDLEAFANALNRLLGDPQFAERLGRNARERVCTDYLGIRHLLQYAELLERLKTAKV
jgi:trehalose synthase